MFMTCYYSNKKLLTVLAFMLMKCQFVFSTCRLILQWMEAMSAPVLKINTFIKKQYVDNISKIFIISQLIFGVNRVSIIGNVKNNLLYFSLAYSIAYTAIIITMSAYICFDTMNYLFLVDVLKYTFCSVLAYTSRGRLLKFYKKLNVFDKEIGYNVKISRNSIHNILQMSLTFILSLIFTFACPTEILKYYINLIFFSPMQIIHAIELHYLGHMIGLHAPRIRMITHYIKLFYRKNNDDNILPTFNDEAFLKFEKQDKKKPQIEMEVLMDLYYCIIKTYDFLNEAMKWQLLVLLMSSFAMSMGVAYSSSMSIISGEFHTGILFANISFMILELLPLLAICLFADQVCGEAHKLRQMLSCSIYENSLDKTSRVAAQAFLSLAEARDLSFSLFNMFNIDISLPFNFMGLLLTYLIILLQFQKVITPNTT